ncbi:MAG TPA: S1 RNA-binding domain-containing protein [Ruminococcus sp.]
MNYRPEGCLYKTPVNQRLISSAEGLTEAMNCGTIIEARVSVCTSSHDLIIDLPCAKGVISRKDGALGIPEGKTRDIALISRVNKIVCFKVRELNYGSNGSLTAKLSRREAQEECQRNYIEKLRAGDIIEAKVTHLEQFGSFVDIGCGIPSLIPIDTISVSRISHPSDRMRVGQMIYAAVKSNESARICLTHKELLGTWEENAADYEVGETVSGIVRSVESYGIFVELTPNLAGLAEARDGITAGMHVSVYIKAIIPEKMKVKLVIVDSCDSHDEVLDFKYRFRESHINKWRYSPEQSDKIIESIF